MESAGINDWREHIAVDDEFVRPSNIPYTCGDPTKLRKAIGWRPSLDFEEIVDVMVKADQDLLAGKRQQDGWLGSSPLGLNLL